MAHQERSDAVPHSGRVQSAGQDGHLISSPPGRVKDGFFKVAKGSLI